MANISTESHVDASVDGHEELHQEQQTNLNGGRTGCETVGKTGCETVGKTGGGTGGQNVDGGLNWRPNDTATSLVLLRGVMDRMARDLVADVNNVHSNHTHTPEQLRQQLREQKSQLTLLELDNATLHVLLSEATNEVQQLGHCNDVLANEARKLLVEVPRLQAELTRHEEEITKQKAVIDALQRKSDRTERHTAAFHEAVLAAAALAEPALDVLSKANCPSN